MRGNDVTPIGITNYRNTNQQFGIKDADRLRHIYVIGKTGVGKSTLLANMAISDIERGNGLCVIDPHGDIATDLISHIPGHRKADLIYFNVTDLEHPTAFNPLHNVHSDYHHLVASGLVEAFKKIWSKSWGQRLEYIWGYALLTLLSVPESTLLDIQPLLTDRDFREQALSYITDENILAFWHNEFDRYSPALRSEATSSILNKTGVFVKSLPLRMFVGQKSRSFRMQHILDNGKILIVNLSKGQVGENASALLGSMLITSLQLAALHRATQREHTRRPFYLYVDEMHTFISLSFVDVLAEARKYGLSLFLTHQYLDQINEEIRAAVFGNVGTLIAFRVGQADAEILAKEFYPVFDQKDLINLPRYGMCLKLMIDGTSSAPFSAFSLSKEALANSKHESRHSHQFREGEISIAKQLRDG